MMTTKQFAERIGVSVRTLIRWHQRGILVPAVVLPTGARRYSEDQVEAMRCRKQEVTA